MIQLNHQLWSYLSEGQKGLIKTGEFLLAEARKHPQPLSDYSYLVFPFAKAYEGFLKKIFLDKGFISQKDYLSDHFRIGKALNPHFAHESPQESVYQKIVNFCQSTKIADMLWNTWKRGRNLLVHYFPHNQLAITFQEAEVIINMIIQSMQTALAVFQP